jgi:hypothetical protein
MSVLHNCLELRKSLLKNYREALIQLCPACGRKFNQDKPVVPEMPEKLPVRLHSLINTCDVIDNLALRDKINEILGFLEVIMKIDEKEIT